MPETILSRLQRYDFRRIALQVIFARLKELASREGVNVEESALLLLAREAGGSMRDAERMLETSIACASSEVVTEAEVASTLGVASRSVVYALCDAIISKDAASALRKVRELHSRGANLESLGRDLLEALRNIAVAKLPSNDSMTPLADLARSRGHRAQAAGRAREQSRRDAAVSPDGRGAGGIAELAVSRSADGDGGHPHGRARAGDGRRRAAARDRKRRRRNRVVVEFKRRRGIVGRHRQASVPTRRMKVEGEVNATAPVRGHHRRCFHRSRGQLRRSARASRSDRCKPDLPELRDFIRARRAALAGFMEQGASLAFSRRRAHRQRAQRHLYPLPERQSRDDRGTCERIFRASDQSRSVVEWNGCQQPRRARRPSRSHRHPAKLGAAKTACARSFAESRKLRRPKSNRS